MQPVGADHGTSTPADSSAGTGIDPPIDAGIEVRALVARSRKGDANAFGQLYDRYLPEIVRYLTYRVGNPDTAEDLAQQVFLKAWQAIPRYEERGVPFKAWLYRMAHNLMVDHHRTRRPTASLEGIDLPEDPDAADPEAERQILAREAHAHLRAALDRLSEDHRQVLVLRFLLEKSAREVGEIMDRKEVTIRGLQMRALQALRREIDRDGLGPSGGLS